MTAALILKDFTRGLALLAVLGAAVFPALALAQKAADPAAAITAKLQQARPDFKVGSITPSEVKEIYEVQLQGGPLLYATADGSHFFLGDLFSVAPDGIVNLAEQRRDVSRQELLSAVSTDDMIVFAARGEAKAHVTVFTDVDCFYCQKLHKEVPAMNARGIEVRYMAYPRAGVGSESYRKIASAWCAKDPNDAMNKLKNREEIPENVCADNPVADQFVLGQQVGVRGTPALVLEGGQMVPGYLSADDLASRMGVE